MKVTFKTGSEANYGSTNGEMFFASDTKQLLLNGVKYIPKKLSELTNDSGFLTSITKSMVENVLNGNITSHTHQYAASPSINGAATTLYGKYTSSGGQQNPDYFGKNKVGALMMNTTVNRNTQYKDWIISDCYVGNDVGGAVAFGVNRQALGAYIMRSASERTEWAESAELLGTHNYASYALPLSGGTLSGNLTCNGSYITMSGGAGAKGYSGYFNNPKRNDRASYSHILGDGYAYGTNAISIGAASYAGIRNTDSDSGTYPYLHWQWMDCLQVQETTSGTAVNCYGAILTNAGGNKDTATFSLCIDYKCVAYGMAGNSEELNNFLSFTNTNASYGRVVVYIADNKSGDTNERIFAGTTSRPRSQSNVKIGNVILGQGCNITDVVSMSVNGVMIHRVAFYFWNKTLSASYDITKETTAMVCTKVNNTSYSGASSYASGSYSVASGYSSVASGASSVASGYYSVASGYSSVASGYSSVASGYYSVASGASSVASGYYSVASGYSSVASGASSVASGYYSVAKHEGSKVYALRGVSGRAYQTVLGRDNIETSAASVVVGWGTSDAARKNIFVLDTNGNATFGSGGSASVTAATFNGDTINAGTLNVAEQLTAKNITIGNHLSISSGVDIEGLTPSMIGAAAASHTHSYLPLSGGTMYNTSLVTYLNADLLDGYHAEVMVKSDIGSTDDLTKFTKRAYFKTAYISEQGDFCSLVVPTWVGNQAENYYITELRFKNGSINPQIRTYSQNNGISSWGTLALLTDNVASSSKWANARTITLTGSVTGSVSIDGSQNVSLATTTNHTHSEYLPLTGGTLTGALTVPKLTSTGNILLGDSSLSAMASSVGIQRHDETGFIGFLKDFNLSNSFNGVVLGWDGNYSLSTNSVRIDSSTFTYKGNSVLHSGNLGYNSSGLSRAVQKDANGNLYIVAPSLFEQGISNNYPKNLRWITEDEGQLVFDTEETAGTTSTVQVSIPVANGTSKGFMKSISTVTDVTGYTPCPVKSGTPYYKEDCLYLGSTEIGYIGIMEYGIQYTYNYGTKHSYLEDYTPDSIPRCVVLCFPDRSSNYRFLFWLSAFDEEDPYIARFYNSAYETWLTIDTASRQIILSYGNTWQS